MKTVYVQFKNEIYNYYTSVNGLLSDSEILKYFKGKLFNLGDSLLDNLQRCVNAEIIS